MKYFKRRALALLLSVCMVLTMMPSMVFAAETSEEPAGDPVAEAPAEPTPPTELEEAEPEEIPEDEDTDEDLDADIAPVAYTADEGIALTAENSVTEAQGNNDGITTADQFVAALTGTEGAAAKSDDKTITLIKDVTVKESTEGGKHHLRVNGEFILDLAGHTLTMGKGSILVIDEGGNLTIKNSGADGKIVGSGSSTAVQAQNGAFLTVESGSISATENETAVVAMDNDTILSITGGKISGEKGAPTVNVQQGATVDITGGEITKTYGEGDKFPTVQIGGGKNAKDTIAIVGGTAKINGDVAVFAKGNLTVSGGEIKNDHGFAISTNGSAEGTDNTSKDAKINITGGTITGADNACGIYAPAGEWTIGGNAEISGGAGIVVRGGTLDVQGGTIKATGSANVTVGDAGTAVPPAGIAVDKNDSYNNGENKVTVSGGTVEAEEGQSSVSYTEKGEKSDGPNGETNIVEISGGTFLSGDAGDETANAFVAENVVVSTDANTKGQIITYKNSVIGFGYGATRQESIDALTDAVDDPEKSEAIEKATADWGDQVMFILFDKPIPANKEVKFTVKNGNYEFSDSCEGGKDGKNNLFAWSFLNKSQTENVAAMPGDWSLSFDNNENINLNYHNTVTVPALKEKVNNEDVVHFATLTAGTDVGNEAMTVTAKSDETVGQYYEVRFDTQKLPQSEPTAGEQQKEYWLGWALKAPEGAAKMNVAKASDAADVIGGGEEKPQLEQKVVGEDSGYALYYKANDPGKGADWVRVTWLDEQGKQCGTTFIHVVFGNITFKPDDAKEITVVSSGFKADGAEALREMDAAVKMVDPEYGQQHWPGVESPVPNALWAAFKQDSEGQATYKARITKDGTTLYTEASAQNVNKGCLYYYSMDNQLKGKGGGKYVIELLGGSSQDLPVANATIEVYEVKFVKGTGVENFDEADTSVFTDKDGLDAVKNAKPNVTLSDGNNTLNWDEEKSSDGYTITLTANGSIYTPSSPSTPTTPPTVEVPTPANGTASVDKPNAIAGDTVKITPKANDGYEVDKVTVTDKNGAAVEVKDNGDGTYSFVMPEDAAQPVTVSVTFKESEGGEVTPPTADALVFSSASQENAIKNRITTNADTSLKLKAADEGVNIGSLADWTVESDDESVVKVLEPSNKLRYMGAGIAHVTVTAKGDNDKVYSIVITINVKPGTPTFTLSHVSSKKARTFTVTTSTVRGATGFQVKYSLKKSLKSSKTKTYVCGKKLKRQTIKANKTKRTYYVRVRAYQTVDGKRVYGAWSKLTKRIVSR